MNLSSTISLWCAEEESDCSWVTIRGSHICIRSGESVKEAFERHISGVDRKANPRKLKIEDTSEERARAEALRGIKEIKDDAQRTGQQLNPDDPRLDVSKQTKVWQQEYINRNEEAKNYKPPKDSKELLSARALANSRSDFFKQKGVEEPVDLEHTWTEEGDQNSDYQKALDVGDPRVLAAQEFAQNYLKAKYGNTLTLYRGVVGGHDKAGLVSYSFDRNVAKNVDSSDSPPGENVKVFKEKVPVSSVVNMTPFVGYSEFNNSDYRENEYEVIVNKKGKK